MLPAALVVQQVVAVQHLHYRHFRRHVHVRLLAPLLALQFGPLRLPGTWLNMNVRLPARRHPLLALKFVPLRLAGTCLVLVAQVA